jgi:hypothetical protein
MAGSVTITPRIVGGRFHFEQFGGRAVTDVRRRRLWEPGWRARHDLLRRLTGLPTTAWARILKAKHTDTGDTLEGDLFWAKAALRYFAENYTHATTGPTLAACS